MRSQANIYAGLQKVSSMLMLLALLWLTVSAPFVYAAAQLPAKSVEKLADGKERTDDMNPLANTNEEKPGTTMNSFSEEYLHEAHAQERHFSILVKYFKCHPDDLYFAFHPRLLSPPPEIYC